MKKIIFIHIPKTAGSTFRQIIDKQFNEGEIIRFYGYDGAIRNSLEQFYKLPDAKKDKYGLLYGHIEFGLHEAFPGKEFTYITLLRDPTERIISHYHYVLRNKDHDFHKKNPNELKTLTRYVSSGISTELNNGQTRVIAAQEHIPFGECGTGMLEKAKSNIENYFSVVGTAEMFYETLFLLKMVLNFKIPFFINKNVALNRPTRGAISKDDLKIIEQYNALDYELYHFALKRFQKQVELYKTFQQELIKFKKYNHIYNKGYDLITLPFYRWRRMGSGIKRKVIQIAGDLNYAKRS